jgi:hypothetical protein
MDGSSGMIKHPTNGNGAASTSRRREAPVKCH